MIQFFNYCDVTGTPRKRVVSGIEVFMVYPAFGDLPKEPSVLPHIQVKKFEKTEAGYKLVLDILRGKIWETRVTWLSDTNAADGIIQACDPEDIRLKPIPQVTFYTLLEHDEIIRQVKEYVSLQEKLQQAYKLKES